MVVVESSMAGGRKEVALAAITLLSAVLQAHGAITDIVTLAMWKRAVRALDVGVEAATSPSCMVPLTVGVNSMVKSLGNKRCCLQLDWQNMSCCFFSPFGSVPRHHKCTTSFVCPLCFVPAPCRLALSCWLLLACCTPRCARGLMLRTLLKCSCGSRSSVATLGQVCACADCRQRLMAWVRMHWAPKEGRHAQLLKHATCLLRLFCG